MSWVKSPPLPNIFVIDTSVCSVEDAKRMTLLTPLTLVYKVLKMMATLPFTTCHGIMVAPSVWIGNLLLVVHQPFVVTISWPRHLAPRYL